MYVSIYIYEIMGANGYGHELDLLIILHKLCISYLGEVDAKRKVS